MKKRTMLWFGRRVGERTRLPKPARVVMERLTRKTEPEGARARAIRSAPFGSKLRRLFKIT